MFNIAKHQIIEGLTDAKFLFLALLVLVAFIINAFVYSEQYALELEDWRDGIQTTDKILEDRSGNLQQLVNQPQIMMKPPAALAFISDSGEQSLPNSLRVNAFTYRNPRLRTRGNEMLPVLRAVDWSFIVGVLMSLMAILLSYDSICGEKQSGTLRMLLSNPLSRVKLFLGKYLGLAFVLLLTLIVGAGVNLTIHIFLGRLPIGTDMVPNIGWALLISFFCLSFVLLFGMAISSMTRRPAISLVVLLILWALVVVAVPGLARLAAEQSFKVRSNFEVNREIEMNEEEITRNHPDDAGNWSGNPMDDNIPRRAAWYKDLLANEERLLHETISQRLNQAQAVQMFSSVSPSGLLGGALEELSGTGITGFKDFFSAARRYQQEMHNYTVEKDEEDRSPNNPHLVYSFGTGSDTGVFSTRPVEDLSSMPRWWSQWPKEGLPARQSWPAWQSLMFLCGNLLMAMFAFIALACYDPR